MGFYISYEKEGKNMNENFGSYYLAIVRRENLRKQGIQATIKEKKCYTIRQTTTSAIASKAEKEVAEKVYKNYLLSPEYKQKVQAKMREGKSAIKKGRFNGK